MHLAGPLTTDPLDIPNPELQLWQVGSPVDKVPGEIQFGISKHSFVDLLKIFGAKHLGAQTAFSAINCKSGFSHVSQKGAFRYPGAQVVHSFCVTQVAQFAVQTTVEKDCEHFPYLFSSSPALQAWQVKISPVVVQATHPSTLEQSTLDSSHY
jgi:hypothetical protein